MPETTDGYGKPIKLRHYLSAVIEQNRPTSYQDYSIDRKAEVLALVEANGGNVLRVANQTGINHATIRYWLNDPRFSEIQKQKQADLAQECESDARYYFQLAREKAPEAPYNQLMTGAAIATDKMLLLRQQPTSITLNLNSDNLTVILQSVLNEITSTETTD